MTNGSKIYASILNRIGRTPLVELDGIRPKGCARILLKVEAENPTGSMKDRMALAMIEAAEGDGRLRPGGHVVEYTGGSTGVSLAMICATKGYTLSIVTSDAFSLEKRNHMAALGADLTIVPSDNGKMDEALTRNMVEAARMITEETGGFWTNQLSNADQISAYHRMGDEIWEQTGGTLDAFVAMTGTAACSRGNSEALHRHSAAIHCVAVEPSESPVFSLGRSGAHKIEGTGAGFVVPLWDETLVDEIATVSTQEAIAMCRKLAASEGIFGGTSTGGNVATAIKLGMKLGRDATIVTIMCDSGVKYLSTAVYATGAENART
ncbi:cysteine synthase family protein [Pseudophaeobacter sp.]|uniref:PLP-dependent cysteine synthase family protein n=1 Tax=Pseudophaeobacter sp. TaxID=1971739 RepID=UPI0032975A2D